MIDFHWAGASIFQTFYFVAKFDASEVRKGVGDVEGAFFT